VKTGAHLSQVPARTDWATPWPLFLRYDTEFHFTLDVCATEANSKCRVWLSPEMDGLSWAWTPQTCWMNPPFGREIGAWMKKAYEESGRGATVVCLVPARTCTAWWHDYAEKASERRFIRGRIRFEGAQHNAPFLCVLIVFRPWNGRVRSA
jgi:phage N-6-adenine-methyltransferase